MTKIVLIRPNENFTALRKYKIYIDGKTICTLKNSEIREIEILEGKHIIEAKIDWCSSNQVEIILEKDLELKFEIRRYKFLDWMRSIISPIVILNFILIRTIKFNYTLLIVIPLFVVMLYFITLGRKKYLKITELKI